MLGESSTSSIEKINVCGRLKKWNIMHVAAKCPYLQDWSYHNYFWHYYNTGKRLPVWVFTLKMVLTLFQTMPIIFQTIMITKREDNAIFTDLNTVSNWFIYLSFSPVSVTISVLLLVAGASIITVIIGYVSDRMMFSRIFGYILQFVLEILSPIMFNIGAATVERLGSGWIRGQHNPFYFFSALIATVIFLILFTAVTYAKSKTIYFTKTMFEVWSSWTTYSKTLCPSLLLQVLMVRTKWQTEGTYTVIALIFVYALLSAVFDAQKGYLNFMVNIGMLSADFLACMIGILHAFAYHYTSLRYSIILTIVAVLVLLAVIFAMLVFDFTCRKYAGLSLPSSVEPIDAVERPGESSYASRSHGRESDSMTETDDLGRGRQRVLYSDSIKNKRVMINVMHYLVTNGEDPLDLAMWLIENSTSAVLKFECYRLLILLRSGSKELTRQILDLKREDVPCYCSQALCDMHYEAVAFGSMNENIVPFIDDLEEISDSVRDLLCRISDAIGEGNQGKTSMLIQEYTRACQDFESLAIIAISHAPNSKQLAHLFGDFYQNLRGDFIQWQYWLSREDILSNRDRASSSQSRIFSSMSGVQKGGADNTILNKVKSQTVVQRVNSRTLVEAVVFFVITILFGIVVGFYRLSPSYMNLLISNRMNEGLYRISKFVYSAASVHINMSMQTLVGCQPEYTNPISEMNRTLRFPSKYVVDWMSSMFQNISDVVSNLERSFPEAQTAITRWSVHDPSDPYYANDTLQYRSCQFNMLSSLITPCACDNSSFYMLYTVFDSYENISSGMVVLYSDVLDYIDACWRVCKQSFLIYTVLVTFFFCVLIIITIILFVLHAKRERKKFWTVFSAVEEGSLVAFAHSMRAAKDNKETPARGTAAETEIEEVHMEEESEKSSVSPTSESQDRRYRYSHFHPLRDAPFIIYCVLIMILIGVVYICQIIPVQSEWMMYADAYRDGREFDQILDKAMIVAVSATLMEIGELTPDKWRRVLENAVAYNSFSERPRSSGIEKQYEEMLAISARASELGAQFLNGTATTDTLTAVIQNAWRDGCIIADENAEWRKQQMDKVSSIRVTSYHGTCLAIVVLLIIYTVVFVIRAAAYTSEFISMKAVLMLLPSNYSATIANFITQFESRNTKKSKSGDIAKFQSRYIIRQALDSVIVLDSSQNILDINKSAVELLGYVKDQLIGGHLESFVDRTDDDQQTADFFSQLSFLGRQNAGNAKFNLHMIKSDGTHIPVSCTLLFLSSATENTPDQGDQPAFAVILRDRSSFNEQEKKLQEAKKTVEMLLYRILPRPMANKLLSKSQMLHSRVERATIIFIAIVNFLDWCRSHTHTEIMELLDVIFTKFDKNISKFPTLVKLKVINGVYMAAGGLFNESSENSHELEAVLFAIRCAKSIKKRNTLTKSNLQLQIGINTGGPVITGILGSDKPLFDVWGDAVNVSARLETSDPFDFIQMSLETGNSLPKGMFDLKEKEGVFLKGKGYTTTYLLDLSAYI